MTETTTASASTTDHLVARFREKAGAVGTLVERVPDHRSAASRLREIAAESGSIAVMVGGDVRGAYPAFASAIGAQGCSLWTPIDAQDALDAPLGLSVARLGVAETGSMLLHEETLVDRAVGLVSQTHVIVCPTAALVPSLDEAGAALREIALRPGGGYASLVTGPSRTADIEMSLTVGVQGPGRVYALFVDDLG